MVNYGRDKFFLNPSPIYPRFYYPMFIDILYFIQSFQIRINQFLIPSFKFLISFHRYNPIVNHVHIIEQRIIFLMIKRKGISIMVLFLPVFFPQFDKFLMSFLKSKYMRHLLNYLLRSQLIIIFTTIFLQIHKIRVVKIVDISLLNNPKIRLTILFPLISVEKFLQQFYSRLLSFLKLLMILQNNQLIHKVIQKTPYLFYLLYREILGGIMDRIIV